MRRFRVVALLGLITVMAVSLAIACGTEEPEPTPVPAPAQPAIDPAELARAVSEAVQQAVPQAVAQAVPQQEDQITAEEIQAMIQSAMAAAAAAIPATATPEEISKMVQAALAATAQPGVTREEMESLVAKAVADSTAAMQPGITAEEVQKLVSDALMAVPTPQVMVVPAPLPSPIATPEQAMSMPKQGGTINWAGIAATPSVDLTCHTTFRGGVTRHVYEGFFAWNASRSAALPQMIGEWSLADDARSYDFSLREGLIFHDGSPVTSADAIASTIRWGGSAHAIAKQVWDIVNPVHSEVDEDTWRMEMSQTFGLWPIYQAFNGTWVQPASIAGEVPPDECIDPETQSIGSGPYRFVEWIPGDRVVMDRFFRYIPRADERDGGGGGQIAYFEQIRQLVIPDASTRSAGLQSGQLHITDNVPGDFRDQLEAHMDVEVRVVGPASPPNLIFNKTAPPMNNKKARQAVLLAADMEAWMIASLGEGGDWVLCGSVFMCDGPWATEAGTEKYFAPPNLEEARRLWNEALEEEGMSQSDQIVLLAANNIDYMDGGGAYTKQILESLHENVWRPNVDWATVIQWKNAGCDKPIDVDSNTPGGGWHMYHTRTGPFDPLTLEPFSKKWSCGWLNPNVDRLVNAWLTAPTLEEQKALIDEMQLLIYEEVPYIHLGDGLRLLAFRSEVEYIPTDAGVMLTGAWFK